MMMGHELTWLQLTTCHLFCSFTSQYFNWQQRQAAIMSKLSPALKELINAPFARPGALPAPPGIKAFYQNLAKDAKARGVGVPAWLSMAVCDTHPFQTSK